jgi:hypothetical protein
MAGGGPFALSGWEKKMKDIYRFEDIRIETEADGGWKQVALLFTHLKESGNVVEVLGPVEWVVPFSTGISLLQSLSSRIATIKA